MKGNFTQDFYRIMPMYLQSFETNLFFQVEKFRIPADDDSDSSISFIEEIREKKGL